MLGNEFLVDRANDVDIDLNRVEVKQRDAEFVRGGHRDCARVGQFFTDEMGYQRDLFLPGGFIGLLQRFLGDDAILHEAPRQAREVGL